jgi:hypothetical protein
MLERALSPQEALPNRAAQFGRPQPAGHQRVAADRADADRQVEAFLDQIDRPVRDADVEAHRRMLRGEAGDGGADRMRPQIERIELGADRSVLAMDAYAFTPQP